MRIRHRLSQRVELQGYTALHIAMQFAHENIFALLVKVYGKTKPKGALLVLLESLFVNCSSPFNSLYCKI